MINATNPAVSNQSLPPPSLDQEETSVATGANTNAAASTQSQTTPKPVDQGISALEYDANFSTTRDPSNVGDSQKLMINPNSVNPNATRANVQGQMETTPDQKTLDSSDAKIASANTGNTTNQTAKRIYADPRELMPVDTVVLHETTRGFMTRGEPSYIDNIVKKTNVNTDIDLKGNSDFVIMQDGYAFQQNRHGNSYSEGSRLNTGIADGTGTLREYKGKLVAERDSRAKTKNFAAISQGRALDIEIDYKSGPSTKSGFGPIGFDTKPMNSKQYKSTVETVVDAAMLKNQGMIAASRRDASDKSPVIIVATHKDVDAGITGQGKLHQDPSGLNMKSFEASVKAELKSRGLPETLISFQKTTQWK